MSPDTILTMPNMDYLADIYESLFCRLDCSFIKPPVLSKKTSDLGRKLGRESFCMPLNNSIGDIVLAIENGATAVVMTTETDPCRYPLYWVSIKSVVDEYFGRDITFFLINHDSPQSALQSVFQIVKHLNKKIRYRFFLKVWKHTMKKVDFLSALNDVANAEKYHEKVKGRVLREYKKSAAEILASKKMIHTFYVFYKFKAKMALIAKRAVKKPVKILLVGEIYEVVEPHANYSIEDYLCSLGCIVKRSLNQNDLAPVISPAKCAAFDREQNYIYAAAKKYALKGRPLDTFGGFGMLTIGHAALARKRGYDGIVHLYSFSCMPEIIAKPFIKKVSEADNIPTISVVVEELASRDVFTNRLEAFVDMVRDRKYSD